MSNVTDRLRQALEPMSLDIREPEPIVAVRRDELQAMLDVIDAADACLVPGFANLTHEQAVARTDALVDALQQFNKAAEQRR